MNKKIKNLFKTGFFHIFGSSVINKIVGFLSNVILVRILTKDEFGIFTCAWNIYSIFLLMNGMGVDMGLLQIYSEQCDNPERGMQVSHYALKLGMAFNICIAIAIAVISYCIPLSIPESNDLLRMLCFLPIFQLIFTLLSSVLRAQRRNQDFARFSTLNTVTLLLFSAVGSLCFREKGLVLGHYAAFIISDLVGIFGMHINLFQHTEKPEECNCKALRSISVVSMCNNGLSQLMYLLDVFVLGIVAADGLVLASYKVATTIPAALSFIPVALITYIYPFFAQNNMDGRWCMNKYKKILMLFGGFNLFLSLGMFLLAPYIIQILYGKEYLDAVTVFRLLSLNYFISATFRVLSGNLLVTQRKLKYNLFVAVLSGGLNVIADYFFIQWWGSIGAALATILVVLLSSILSTGYLLHVFKLKIVSADKNVY